jgi:hypothetical protein
MPNMPLKDDEIAIADVTKQSGKSTDPPTKRDDMGGTGKKNGLPGKDDRKAKKPSPPPAGDDDIEDGDIEDGDIATPKRDRHDEDDQPL